MATAKKKRILIPLNNPRPQRTWPRVVLFVLRPLLVPLSFVVGKTYKLCFGWLDRKLAKENEERFAKDIRTHLPFLFADHGAQIVPNDENVPFPPGFDTAYVTVEAETLRFRFVRGRGDFSVRVASAFAPQEWEDIELAVAAIGDSKEKAKSGDFYDLRTLPGVFQPLFDDLKNALSDERFRATLDEAVRINNERVDQYAAKLQEQGITPRFLQ